MATFLASPAMNPALRARVERAVSARARAKHHAPAVGLSSPFARSSGIGRAWLVPLVIALALGAVALASYRAERRAVVAEKAALTAALGARRALFPPGRPAIAAAPEWVRDAAADDAPADRVAPSLRGPGALDALLAQPALYVRMTLAEARDPKLFDDAVRGSTKDSFLVCLLHPPASDSEKDRLAKVRGVYFDGAKVDDETANVRRLAPAQAGLLAIGASVSSAIDAADDLGTLRKLRRDLEAAPIAEAAKAARAEVLLVVVDEPKVARVLFVDLASPGALLRIRRPLAARRAAEDAAGEASPSR